MSVIEVVIQELGTSLGDLKQVGYYVAGIYASIFAFAVIKFIFDRKERLEAEAFEERRDEIRLRYEEVRLRLAEIRLEREEALLKEDEEEIETIVNGVADLEAEEFDLKAEIDSIIAEMDQDEYGQGF